MESKHFKFRVVAGVCLSIAALVGTLPDARGQAAADDPLAAAALENLHPLTFQNGKLSGPGADLLRREASNAQFFLIGEDHGIADIPQFTAALYRDIQPYGYDHFVAEVGPESATVIADMASRKDADRAFTEFFRTYPFAMPFYTWREEVAMAQSIMAASKEGKSAFWGIDQEFILSPQFFFNRLAADERDPAIKKLLGDLAAAESAAVAKCIEAKNPNAAPTFMVREDEPDLSALEKHYHAHRNTAALTILDELKQSRGIYRRYATGKYYENNAERIDLMKRHFLDYYNRAAAKQRAPRVLFKMGAMHTKRGHSFLGFQDVGNFASEFAIVNGSTSFHLFVVAAGGAQNAYNPFADEAAKRSPVEVTYAAQIAKLAGSLKPGEWAVVDLRPLRRSVKKLAGDDRELRETILGYDAILLIPEVSPATNW